MLTLSSSQVKAYLPHRYPYLLVDKVTDLTPGKHIIAIKNVTCNEKFFEGHFPNNPIMPGTLILEAMAQVASILANYHGLSATSAKTSYLLAAIDRVRFKQCVFPGDQLHITASIQWKRAHFLKCHTKAMVNQTLVATADITGASKPTAFATD